MGIAEIHALPREEKLRLMELLWEDLSADEGSLESPECGDSSPPFAHGDSSPERESARATELR